MKKIALLIVCAGLALAPAACGQAQTYTVELAGNPTTGYAWTYTMSEEGVVREVSNEYVADEQSNQAVGAGGVFRFTFAGVREGTVELRFVYSRSWENVAPQEQVIYTLAVDKRGKVSLAKPAETVEQSGAGLEENRLIDSSSALINGQTIAYSAAEGEEFSEQLLLALLERALAFYDALKSKDFAAARELADADWAAALDAAAHNEEFNAASGAELALRLDNYVDLVAPARAYVAYAGQVGGYQVSLELDFVSTLLIDFADSGDGPLVTAISLIIE